MLLQLLKLIIRVTALTNNCFNSFAMSRYQIGHENTDDIIILHFNANRIVRQEKSLKERTGADDSIICFYSIVGRIIVL